MIPESFLLACIFKQFTGLDCPGCGFQRSFLALLKGNLSLSYQLYPPMLFILIACAYILIGKYCNLKNHENIKKGLIASCMAVITINYLFKLMG